MAFKLNLGSLTVQIGADTDEFEKGAGKVRKELKITAKAVRDGVNRWGKWAAAATAAATAVATTLIKTNISAIRDLNNLANAANTTVKSFQQGAFAAQQFGIEQEKYGDILKDVNDRIGDFITTGGGPMLDFFEQIAPKVGVTVDQFKKLSGQDALGLYIQSLQKANLTQAEMTFFMEALASDSTRLIPLFENNSKAMKQMTEEAEALGIGLDQIDVTQAIEAQKQLDKAAFIIDNELKKSAAELAPFVSALTIELTKVANEAGGFAQFAVPAFEAVGKAIATMANTIQVVKLALKGIEIIGRGVTAALAFGFQTMAEVITGIGNTILEGWRLIFKELGELVGGISDDAKEVFDSIADGINSIKGEVPSVIKDFASSQIEALAKAKDEMQAIALEKIPSQKFEEFIARVKKTAEEAAPAIASSLTGAGTGKVEAGTGMDQGEKSEADRIREENQKILEALLEEGMIREETLLGRLAREKEILDEARRNQLISEEEFQRANLALTEKSENAKLDIVTSTLGALQQALAIGGKKVTKAQQAIAVVQAVIKGKQAAVDAWQAGMSTGGPFAPVVAAAYTAASIAKTAGLIQSIKSGGKSMPSSGGGGITPVSGGSGTSNGGQTQQQSSTKTVNLNFVGSGAITNFVRDEIVPALNEAAGDNVKFQVPG